MRISINGTNKKRMFPALIAALVYLMTIFSSNSMLQNEICELHDHNSHANHADADDHDFTQFDENQSYLANNLDWIRFVSTAGCLAKSKKVVFQLEISVRPIRMIAVLTSLQPDSTAVETIFYLPGSFQRSSSHYLNLRKTFVLNV